MSLTVAVLMAMAGTVGLVRRASAGPRMRRTALCVIFVVALLLSVENVVTAVDSSWTQMVPAQSPSARIGHGMTYDSKSDRVILLGGETAAGSNVLNNETWAYNLDSNTWENRNPSARPSARFAQAMAYDAGSDRTILFGGWTGTIQNLETWAYDYTTNTWTNVTSVPCPPAGVFVAMAYDAESDRMILFGGSIDRSDFSVYSAETWAYDFVPHSWTRMNPANAPSPRAINGLMAYDVQSDRIVLFGGRDGNGNFADTWEYDYNSDTWTQTTPQTGPSGRHAGATAYDASTDRVVLFGGYTASGTSDETWVYDVDTDAWTQATGGVGPSARFGAAMVDDTESARIVLFGGSSGGDATWVLRLGLLPPAVVITSPKAGATLPSATVTVTGTASDDIAVERVDVSLDNATWIAATGTTSWSATLTLVEGANTIYVRVTDTAGNAVTSTIQVTIDTAGGTTGGQGVPGWVWPVVGVGIVGSAAAAYLVMRRRRKPGAQERQPRE